jgi:tRNA (guanine26-N2/guanine27-N2)-dimethyltransferase
MPCDSNDIVLVEEGGGSFLVYSPVKYKDPAWAPVFYNPRMKCSRDISSAIIEAYARFLGKDDLVVVDALSATGIRGIRYLLENTAVQKVILNDLSSRAVKLMQENVKLNNLSDTVEIRNEDAVRLLTSLRGIDIVDIDPFGSPAEFIDPALRCLKHKGLLCVTATDLPPLLGKYPKTCIRKYFSKSILTEFSRELAVRILAYFVAREAAKLRRSVAPIFSFYHAHHVRICFLVLKRESNYSGIINSVGFVKYNPSTLERELAGLLDPSRVEGNWVLGGPIWIAPLASSSFSKILLEVYRERLNTLNLCRYGEKIVSSVINEAGMPPFYFTTEKIAQTYSLPKERSAEEVVESLLNAGFSASLTHFDPKGFKTNARVHDILQLL